MTQQADPTEVEVAIGVTTWLASAPSRVWIADFEMPWTEARQVRDQLERLIAENPQVPHVVTERGGRTSWGGDSGERLHLGLFLAQSLADGFIAAAALSVFTRLAAKLKPQNVDAEEWRSPLGRSEAVEEAKWRIVYKYGRIAEGTLDSLPIDPEGLTLISDSRNEEQDTWTVVLRDKAGSTYRVTLGRIAGLATLTHIEREVPGS
ncbi:hypothetical protein ACFWDZ_32355 [Micromonospora aurantiaca]|uniref:hypothetical protein n=1 Tax=Micromonospora aurantiaca (nom. illeg.) TaxID=47850 RepID=UPI0013C35D2C|nr:hypothetical protein [Micromonospora aurantiaca]